MINWHLSKLREIYSYSLDKWMLSHWTAPNCMHVSVACNEGNIYHQC